MLENDRLKPYFLQIDLENMILAAKNIRMVSLVGITSEFRTGPRFMPARQPFTFTYAYLVAAVFVLYFKPGRELIHYRYDTSSSYVYVRSTPVCVWMDRSTTMHALAAGAHDGYCRWCPDR